MEHGANYNVDGTGFDYSMTRAPEVTDDALLSMFFNGTFYSGAAQRGESGHPIPVVEHPDFEVGTIGKKHDLMFHLSETVASSLLKMVVANDGFNVTGFMLDSFLNH